MPQSAQSGAVLVLDSLARLVLIACAAILPLCILPVAWASVSQSKTLLIAIVALVVAILWAFARLLEGIITLPRSSLIYAVLLLPLAYAVSAATTGFSGFSLVGQGVEQDTLAAVIIWYALFILALLLFAERPAGLRNVIRAVAAGMTALFALQALYIFLPSWFNLGVMRGATANILGSWHDLGIMASLGFFLSMALFRSGVFGGPWRVLAGALGALSGFFLIVVHFTDVFWGAAALMACAFVIAVRSAMRTDNRSFAEASRRSIAFLILGVLFGVAATLGTSVWEKLPAPVLITEIEVRPSWQGTFDVGRQSLGAPQTLLFGTGPNSFIREWSEHKPAGVNLTPFWNADFNFGVGIIPTSIFTAGVVGLLAWLGIVLVLFGYAWRFAQDARLTGSRMLFGTLLAASLYLLAFHMIYTPGAALTGMMFLILGLLAAVAVGDAPARMISTRDMTSAVVFALLILLVVPVGFAAGTTVREVVSNLYVNRAATVYQASSDVVGAGRMIEKSLAISPRNDRAHRAASELGLVELSLLLAQGGPQSDEARTKLQQTLQATIQHGLTAVEIDDANYQNWLVLAQVYGSLAGANVEGAYEQARATYERALQANPTNPVPKLRLAQLASARGDRAAARTNLQEALAIKQDFAAAYYLLSQIEAADGNNEAAIQNAATAVQLVPEDPLGWFNLGLVLYSANSNADAAAAFEQAIVRANDYSNAYFYLGTTYYRLQRPNDAVLAFRRVLELNPSEVWLTQVISNLQRGADPFEGVSQVQ